MNVTNHRCNGTVSPLGIDDKFPNFSWDILSGNQDFTQSAYQIKVTTSEASLRSNEAMIWDTGKVCSEHSIQIPYNGKRLRASTYYYWKVKIWNQNDESSDWSTTAQWQMGLLSTKDWGNAKWIGLEKQNSVDRLVPGLFFQRMPAGFNKKTATNKLPQFRKEYTTTKKIKRATLYISGLGQYEILLNGKNINNNFLNPGWTNYDKTILYNTYDITDKLSAENVFAVSLGNGMYNIPSNRYYMFIGSFGYPKLIAKLNVEFEDGSNESLVTDSTWKAAESAITCSSIFGGEDYDANRASTGWEISGFDDSSWQSALQIGNPNELLKSQLQPAIVYQKTHQPIHKIEISEGVWVYDFGTNFAGIPSVEISSKTSSTIIITPAELTKKNGDTTIDNLWGEHYYKYTTKGSEKENWQPQFTYYGFRYLQVKGAVPHGYANPDNLPEIIRLEGITIANDAEIVGAIATGSSILNDIHQLILTAMSSNFVSVMTDCPHREKLGWIEQAYLMAPSYQFTYNCDRFFQKVIQDMQDAQLENGLVPCIAPEYTAFSDPYREAPEWGSACIMLPWMIYQFYGDKNILSKSYKSMQDYLAFLQQKSIDNILNIGVGDWMDLGPKTPGPSQLTPIDLVDTAMYYQCTTTLILIADVLGLEQDKSYYQSLGEQIKEAFNTSYFDEKNCTYGSNSQTALALALELNLVPENSYHSVLNSLVQVLEETNYQLTSGDIGHRYLLKALEKNGLSDIIYKMHTNPSQPSYAYQLKQGATALTESWQADRSASHNHCMLGHLMEWYYTGLAGIGQSAHSVGFKDLIIQPAIIAEIKNLSVTFQSPHGKIAVNWRVVDRKVEFTIIIPSNTQAIILLPSPELVQKRTEINVGSGEYMFICNYDN